MTLKFTELKFCDGVKSTVTDAASDIEQLPVSLDRSKQVGRIMAKCFDDVKKELDKWLSIYLDEEKKYVEYVESQVGRAKAISATMRKSTDKVAAGELEASAALNDFLLQQKTLVEIVSECDSLGKQLVAHQSFRGNDCFTDNAVKAIAEKALGTHYDKVIEYYKAQRAPAIQWVADVKKTKIKLDEYKTRGEDCVKTVESLQTKGKSAQKETYSECNDLFEKSKLETGRVESLLKDRGPLMSQVIDAVKKKTKLDAKQMKAHETYVGSIPDQIAKLKSVIKTLTVAAGHLDERMKKHAGFFTGGADKKLSEANKLLTTATKTIKEKLEPMAKDYTKAWKTLSA